MTVSSVEAARAALDRGEFRDALAAVAGADETPEALEVRASAAYGAGEFEAAISSWERLHTVHLAAGRREEAAFAAARVALNLMCETGLMAPVRGWVGRARRLAEGAPAGPVDALLAITRAYERILCGDPGGALAPALEAVELGTAFGVDPARGLGRVALARLAVHDGEVDHAMELLDEVAVDLAAGEFDPITTGNIYCELICVAQWVIRHDRAREWTEVMERWRQGAPSGAIHGRCRVHRAEMLRVTGPADRAEEEALAACAELRPWMRREFGWPLVELGNIRLRRGDLVGAEEAFLEAHEHAWSPQPGLALLRLAQGDVAASAVMVRNEILHPSQTPWKEQPPFGDLRLVPLLAAQAEIAEVAGDAATCSSAAESLAVIHRRYPSAGLEAERALAQARAALVAGRADDAIGPARLALERWIDLGAPFDAAAARVVLGRAYDATGASELAEMEWTAAAAAFSAFGATGRAESVAALVAAGRRTPAPAEPATAATATLVREGDRWRIGCRDAEAWVPDLKGIQLLARLLAEPGREIHVLDLVGAGVVSEGLPVLDDEARSAYRRRLAEVEDDIAEAERDNDEARRILAERDKQYLLAELAGAVGLGGRHRTSGGTVERARTSVTRSLRYALARIAEQLPELGAHLDGAVRTGTACCYRPDPVTPVEWTVQL